VKQLDVIYENDLCIVINKPSGLAVQGGNRAGLSLDMILAQRAALEKIEVPLLVHRLDRDTSGLVLVAKNKAAAAFFSRLLGGNSPAGKAVIKRYLAICKGLPPHQEGVIRTDLEIRGAVKKSETRYRLLSGEGEGEFSLLELELGSGRMHQIRRHLALAGNPVLGDDKYGDFKLNHSLRKTMKLRNLLLHAARIIIPPTPDGLSLDASAPPPDYFEEFILNIFTPRHKE
jgi:23S rRNA pseudouridine955/2504/2580 synthase